MNETEILNKLQGVFEDVFLEPVTLTKDLSAHDVDEWDSLKHIVLIVAIEKSFGIRFQVGEVENTKNIGELISLIEKHLKN